MQGITCEQVHLYSEIRRLEKQLVWGDDSKTSSLGGELCRGTVGRQQ